MKHAIAACIAIGLAGCATATPDAAPGQVDNTAIARACNAAPAQYHIGHDATQALGAAVLKDSGARSLRWGAPNSAWTMDYREDRVNVRYDASMKIIEITCG